MNETSTPPTTGGSSGATDDSTVSALVRRITRLEIVVGAVTAAVMAVLVVAEPSILEAPFQNERTLLFTVGGTVIAVLAFAAMLRLGVPSVVRVIVLLVPFVLVNWWLISPYFVDDVVDEDFATSISEQLSTVDETPANPAGSATQGGEGEVPTDSTPPAEDGSSPAGSVDEDPAVPAGDSATEAEPVEQEPPATAEPTADEAPPPATEPVLLGAGRFVGLAGHSGTGDAGLFRNPDGSLVLRFENFDIENGPDLEVYLVPGADQTSLPDGSIHLGALKGNVGDQNYDVPPGTDLVPGEYTALVWCEAFSVEFVGATIAI